MLRVVVWGAGTLAVLLLAFLLFWKLWFLRQPVRDVPAEGIVSPASGKLVRVVRFEDGEPQDVVKAGRTLQLMTSDVAENGWLLVIVMTPLDVHYQRAPYAGEVVGQEHRPGGYRNAVVGASSLSALENEKNEILLETERGKMKVVQVAGAAARRISSYVDVGDTVAKGDVIGLIDFGSQVVLVLPDVELKVSEGDRMTDGETVIA